VREAFHRTTVLFHDIIKILAMADHNGGLVSLVVARNRCRIRATLIDGNFLREPLAANGLV
jgi:hypothetical protein